MFLQLKVLRCCARFEFIDVLVVLRCHLAHMLHSLRNWYAEQLVCSPIVTDLCQEREGRYADRVYFLRLKCSVACFKVGVESVAYRVLRLRLSFQKQRVITLTISVLLYGLALFRLVPVIFTFAFLSNTLHLRCYVIRFAIYVFR